LAASTNGELDYEDEMTAQAVLSRLSLEQKIGQLFFLGFKGQNYDENTKKELRKIRPGGVLIFRRNINSAEQISNLNHAMQVDFIDNHTVPLFIAIDQEGGLVTRIQSRPPLPSALALGQTNSRDIVGRMGFYTGSLMKALGFNMNLAPVLDIADPKKSTFIGTRSFSGDAESVGKMAFAFAQGLQMAGVVSTLKHFPGHGGPAADSHKQIPVMKDDLQGLLSFHLKPFTYLTSKFDPPAIMVAHVLYPNIDKDPATYSKVLVEDVLRKKILFKGLIITDDIDMAGAKKIKDSGEQAIRALEAGVDMIMVAWHKDSQKRAFNAVKQAVLKKRISIERIDSSVLRILDTKIKYGLFNKPPTPSMKTVNTIFSDPSFKRAVDQVMTNNIERSFESINLERPLAQDQKVSVFALTPKFYQSFTQDSPSDSISFHRITSAEKFQKDVSSLKNTISLLYTSGAKTLSMANSLTIKQASKVIVVNTGIPALIPDPKRFMGVINLYTPHAGAGVLIAKHLYSEQAEIREPAATDDDSDDEIAEDSALIQKTPLRMKSNNGYKHPRTSRR
jgi:beta-N-acetylhexosaminidase